MPSTKLKDALTSVEWDANVVHFLSRTTEVNAMSKAAFRLATWARQIEVFDAGNPSLCFVREMQVSGHHVTALLALALYNPAAASMRTVLETALYYTYFRTHPMELATLARNPNFFLQKVDILKYHRMHTPSFTVNQKCFELENRLSKWYAHVSGIIHGQVPGVWLRHPRLADTRHVDTTLETATETFCEGEDIVHALLICTVGYEKWDSFSPAVKKCFLQGVKEESRIKLGLDRG